MSLLFEPARIGQMSVPNRFVRSATYDGCADEAGHVTEKQLRLFAEFVSDGGRCAKRGSRFRFSVPAID